MSYLKDCGFINDGKWKRAQMKHPGPTVGFPHNPTGWSLILGENLFIKEHAVAPHPLLLLTILLPFFTVWRP